MVYTLNNQGMFFKADLLRFLEFTPKKIPLGDLARHHKDEKAQGPKQTFRTRIF